MLAWNISWVLSFLFHLFSFDKWLVERENSLKRRLKIYWLEKWSSKCRGPNIFPALWNESMIWCTVSMAKSLSYHEEWEQGQLSHSTSGVWKLYFLKELSFLVFLELQCPFFLHLTPKSVEEREECWDIGSKFRSLMTSLSLTLMPCSGCKLSFPFLL